MGVHSHTFVKGGSTMCRNTAQCSYYTLSYMFNAYISSVVGRKIGQGEAVLGDTGSGDPQAHLQNGTYRTIGLTTLSGNMFKAGQSEESSLESSSEESQSSSHASTRSSAESSAESSAGLHGRSGLSRGAVIGISVGASIGGLLIFAAAAFFAVRWWRTRSLRDRAHIEQVQDMLGTGAVPAAATAAGRLQGVAITTHDLPPVYDDFVADKADDCKDKK
ncbi:hypothetical protein H4R21_003546 [Coemansia helicoidea]|uniref:Uncharacterized protein n=1 Tax=Coemansia helicoidea TaxID=1286919 RepID=A0ACC1L2R1_9FUNG|nr:hypothetical protein H4R21_003546 [Coemansia helicoidea]